MAKTLFLLDGHAQIYRAYYALESMRSADGKPSGAIYGFTRTLREILSVHKPDYIAAVFDTPAPTFRKELYPDYKANRKPPPEELIGQIEPIQDIVRAHRIPIYAKEGFEADDVIGTLCRQAREAHLEVVIVSGDKDLAQLLEEGVRLYDPRKDSTTTPEIFTKKKRITPRQLPDIMGLWGDSSDNIPGVPGIGEKIATDLILKYETLESLLEHAEEIKGKRGQAIVDNRESALLSRELATIDTEVEVELDLTACERQEADEAALLPLFESYSFSSLIRELTATAVHEEDEERIYHLVDDAPAFSDFMNQLLGQSRIAFDVETTSTDPLRAELVGMSFSWEPRTGWYLPFKAPEGEPTLPQELLRKVASVLEDPKVEKTGHNIKYDALVMLRNDIALQGIRFDSMLASHLTAGHIRGHSMDACAERLLHLRPTPIVDLIGKGKKQVTMDQVPLEQVCPYAAEDADISLRLATVLQEQLEKEDLLDLFQEIELPLSLVLTEMQGCGILLDTERLRMMSEDMGRQLEGLTQEIHYLAGREFNIASTKQLAEVLYDELEFPVLKKTKTGRSTKESVLEELAQLDHPKRALPKLLLEYRTYSKLKSTYLDALPELVHPETRRIHTTFHQEGTATGRLSSSNPNLQNIPVRSEKGRGIRAAFVPEPGWLMLAADYSQIELRMLAHLSGDPTLSEAFRSGADIHRAVAAQIFDKQPAAVSAEERQAAKAVNFGVIYGQTAFGLSQTTEMSRFEAQDFIDCYFQAYPEVNSFIDQTLAAARDAGYVTTLLGRRRAIPDLDSSNKMKKTHAERMAINTAVQGSAADLMKLAMIQVHRKMKAEALQARMLLQIHDELLFEVPPQELPRMTELVKGEMETAMALTVPLVADTGVGASWLEAK
ncbi:MAG: DNA polymerase I [Planctomycetota bacterium]|jgi:DNA polymerase-1